MSFEVRSPRIEVHTVLCPRDGEPALVECECSPRPGGRRIDVRWCSRFPGERFHCPQGCTEQLLHAEDDLL